MAPRGVPRGRRRITTFVLTVGATLLLLSPVPVAIPAAAFWGGGGGGGGLFAANTKTSHVVEVSDNPERFIRETVLGGDDEPKTIWFVDYYASWCPHCQHFAPVYEQVSQTVWKEEGGHINGGRGVRVRFAAMDCATGGDVGAWCSKMAVHAYPTLRVYNVGLYGSDQDGHDKDAAKPVAERLKGLTVSAAKSKQGLLSYIDGLMVRPKSRGTVHDSPEPDEAAAKKPDASKHDDEGEFLEAKPVAVATQDAKASVAASTAEQTPAKSAVLEFRFSDQAAGAPGSKKASQSQKVPVDSRLRDAGTALVYTLRTAAFLQAEENMQLSTAVWLELHQYLCFSAWVFMRSIGMAQFGEDLLVLAAAVKTMFLRKDVVLRKRASHLEGSENEDASGTGWHVSHASAGDLLQRLGLPREAVVVESLASDTGGERGEGPWGRDTFFAVAPAPAAGSNSEAAGPPAPTGTTPEDLGIFRVCSGLALNSVTRRWRKAGAQNSPKLFGAKEATKYIWPATPVAAVNAGSDDKQPKGYEQGCPLSRDRLATVVQEKVLHPAEDGSSAFAKLLKEQEAKLNRQDKEEEALFEDLLTVWAENMSEDPLQIASAVILKHSKNAVAKNFDPLALGFRSSKALTYTGALWLLFHTSSTAVSARPRKTGEYVFVGSAEVAASSASAAAAKDGATGAAASKDGTAAAAAAALKTTSLAPLSRLFLTRMRGFVSNFFGCAECRGHFLRDFDRDFQALATSATSTTPLAEHLTEPHVWLWWFHNRVTQRIKIESDQAKGRSGGSARKLTEADVAEAVARLGLSDAKVDVGKKGAQPRQLLEAPNAASASSSTNVLFSVVKRINEDTKLSIGDIYPSPLDCKKCYRVPGTKSFETKLALAAKTAESHIEKHRGHDGSKSGPAPNGDFEYQRHQLLAVFNVQELGSYLRQIYEFDAADSGSEGALARLGLLDEKFRFFVPPSADINTNTKDAADEQKAHPEHGAVTHWLAMPKALPKSPSSGRLWLGADTYNTADGKSTSTSSEAAAAAASSEIAPESAESETKTSESTEVSASASAQSASAKVEPVQVSLSKESAAAGAAETGSSEAAKDAGKSAESQSPADEDTVGENTGLYEPPAWVVWMIPYAVLLLILWVFWYTACARCFLSEGERSIALLFSGAAARRAAAAARRKNPNRASAPGSLGSPGKKHQQVARHGSDDMMNPAAGKGGIEMTSLGGSSDAGGPQRALQTSGGPYQFQNDTSGGNPHYSPARSPFGDSRRGRGYYAQRAGVIGAHQGGVGDDPPGLADEAPTTNGGYDRGPTGRVVQGLRAAARNANPYAQMGDDPDGQSINSAANLVGNPSGRVE